MKKLLKSRTDSKISGVCGGLGVYFGIDSNIFRIVFIIGLFISGIFPVALAYLVMACIIPKETDIFEQ